MLYAMYTTTNTTTPSSSHSSRANRTQPSLSLKPIFMYSPVHTYQCVSAQHSHSRFHSIFTALSQMFLSRFTQSTHAHRTVSPDCQGTISSHCHRCQQSLSHPPVCRWTASCATHSAPTAHTSINIPVTSTATATLSPSLQPYQ